MALCGAPCDPCPASCTPASPVFLYRPGSALSTSHPPPPTLPRPGMGEGQGVLWGEGPCLRVSSTRGFTPADSRHALILRSLCLSPGSRGAGEDAQLEFSSQATLLNTAAQNSSQSPQSPLLGPHTKYPLDMRLALSRVRRRLP